MTPDLARVTLELVNRAPTKGAEAETVVAVKKALVELMRPKPAVKADVDAA